MWHAAPLPSLPYFFICSGRQGSIRRAILKFPEAVVVIRGEIRQCSSVKNCSFRLRYCPIKARASTSPLPYIAVFSTVSAVNQVGSEGNSTHCLLMESKPISLSAPSLHLRCKMGRTVCAVSFVDVFPENDVVILYRFFYPQNATTYDALSQ